MKKETRELLEKVIENRLKDVLSEENKNENAFKEAMEAIDRQLKIDQRELDLQKEEIKHEYDMEKESVRQEFELKKEDKRQEFEISKEDKRQTFELEKEVIRNNAEDSRASKEREHQITLETLRQNFKEKELQAMKAIEEMKYKFENDQAAKDRLVKCTEIALAVLVTPVIEAGFKKAFAAMICDFEKDYNFTTFAGKSLSNLFKK